MLAPMFRRRLRITAIAAAGLLLIGGLVFHPLAIHLAQVSARERGWTLTVHHVRVGSKGVWFKGIHASHLNVRDFQVELAAALVPWSKLASRNTLIVTGGTIDLPERLKSLSDEYSTSQHHARENARSSQLNLHVSGLTVRWPGVKSESSWANAWGVSGDLARDVAAFKVDRIEVARQSQACVLLSVAMAIERVQAAWKLDKLVIDQAGLELRSDSDSLRTARLTSPAPIRRKANQKPSTSDASVKSQPQSIDVIERFAALIAGLQGYATSLRQLFAQSVATEASAEISNASVKWSRGAQSLNIGPFKVRVQGKEDRLTVNLEQSGVASEERRFVQLQIPMTPSIIEFKSEIGFVSLQSLGVKEADLGLLHVDSAKLRLNVNSDIDELAGSAKVTASGEIIDLSVQQPWLASRVVTGISAEFAGSGGLTWNSGGSLRINDLSLRLGHARLDITADIQRSGNETRAKVDVSVPLAACEDLIESLPSGLAPLASQVKLDGTLALQAGISFDTQHPQRTDTQWELANGCRVRSASPSVSPDRFRESFILEVPDANGTMIQRAFGPGTASWVPLATMTQHLTHAVLVCEDGRFFYHNGFDSQAIRNSIRDNLLRGRFMRGGSTVTMQLAKNLYLRREKTVSRKLQEAALTLLLEQSFSKNEIMELYWNVVELGPGVYGVGEASQFYFGTTPTALSPAQAFYLGSILPNPKSMHFLADGKVSRGWLNQVRRLLTVAHSRHYLSDDELRLALEEELHFGVTENGSPASAGIAPNVPEQELDDPHEGLNHEVPR